ncbi:Hypothetical predicted protein [Octopus vulgaris]|uniref:SCAN domain-containing protein 3-like n=1 Tax=Octopus vulgaris TaxID=6645 RepID=A0AA36AZU0_OCTVU|nr:Hypothetical predicted protein [Octopus vulgaris]
MCQVYTVAVAVSTVQLLAINSEETHCTGMGWVWCGGGCGRGGRDNVGGSCCGGREYDSGGTGFGCGGRWSMVISDNDNVGGGDDVGVAGSLLATSCLLNCPRSQLRNLPAKHGKNHTIGEQLIKSAISIFLKTVQQKDDRDVRAMLLSNNTVSSRIDEMGQGVENQFLETLISRKFSLQMDESAFRDSEALLLTFVRYIEHDAFHEEIFCKSLETTITAKDIPRKLKHYLDGNKIPKAKLLSCAADSAPGMMGKKTGCLEMMMDENPNMSIVHCVIHRENFVAKKLSPVLTSCDQVCQYH